MTHLQQPWLGSWATSPSCHPRGGRCWLPPRVGPPPQLQQRLLQQCRSRRRRAQPCDFPSCSLSPSAGRGLSEHQTPAAAAETWPRARTQAPSRRPTSRWGLTGLAPLHLQARRPSGQRPYHCRLARAPSRRAEMPRVPPRLLALPMARPQRSPALPAPRTRECRGTRGPSLQPSRGRAPYQAGRAPAPAGSTLGVR